jgi:hypothetical protein
MFPVHRLAFAAAAQLSRLSCRSCSGRRKCATKPALALPDDELPNTGSPSVTDPAYRRESRMVTRSGGDLVQRLPDGLCADPDPSR